MDLDDLNFGSMDFGVTQDNFSSKFYIPSASDCMRCGMCLSSCPTYNLFQIEAETPRHRIRSIDKILNDNQPITTEEQERLDNCLQCRACEAICPSRMAYGELFNETQRQLVHSPNLLAKIAFWLIEQKRFRSLLMPLISLYLKSGMQNPLRKSALLKKIGLAEAESLVSKPVVQKLKEMYPSKIKKVRGRVGLFTGCIAEYFDHLTLQATIELLTTIGFEVVIPGQQSCCGAIHQHSGQSGAELITNNIEVFNSLNLDAIIYTATGCGAMLNEYRSSEHQSADIFKQHLFEISDFLLQHWPAELSLKPAELKVAVHEPCSQRNVLKNQQAGYDLLGKIPGITIVPLTDNHLCCGAGGSYMLTHQENAAELRAKKIQAIIVADADKILSSNFGCALYLNKAGIKVVHPIQLLVDQLALQ